MTPLETRSLPGAIWERIPSAWVSWDLAFQTWIEKNCNPQQSPLKELRWMTETHAGIFWGAFIVAALVIGLLWRNQRFHFSLRKWTLGLLFFLTSLGCADLLSSQFKIAVGRLKPHVNFYNPNFLPALSLPSNHAFNTAFVLAYVWMITDSMSRQKNRWFFAVGAALVGIIGASRVCLGQHYPLDVLFGWILGAIFASLSAKLYRRVAFFTKRN